MFQKTPILWTATALIAILAAGMLSAHEEERNADIVDISPKRIQPGPVARAVSNANNPFEDARKLGRTALEKKDWNAAEKKLTEALRLRPADTSTQQDLAESQYQIALAYQQGEGVAKNPALGIVWHRKAAEIGHAPAQYSLGCAYLIGIGAEKDNDEAAYWIGKSAEQNYAPAQAELAAMYYAGNGVPQDFTQAQELCQKAANQGLARAQFNLAVMFNEGKGTERSKRNAIRWFRKAANQGYPEAIKVLRSSGLEI